MERTILVTGGAGYIGSQLIRDLARDEAFAGCTIRIYDNMERGTYQSLMDLPRGGRYQFFEGDILDRATLADAMNQVWAVIHLAARVKTPLSYDHPNAVNQVNYWGAAAVVDEAIKAEAERFIYASSASVYGLGGPFTEEDTCRPVSPYSTSKLRGEAVVMESGQQRGLRATSLRLGTTFGDAPAIRFDAVTNRLAYLAAVGRSMVVYGSGDQLRPVLHVRDASAAIRFCLAHDKTIGGIYNALSVNVSVNDLVNAIHAILPDAPVAYTDQDVPSSSSFEVSVARLNQLGWSAQISLESGLGEVIQRLSALHEMPTAPDSLLRALEE